MTKIIIAIPTYILSWLMIDWFMFETPALRALAQKQVITKGVVLVLEPTNHASYRYSYRAGGQSYEGFGGIKPGLCPGQKISIAYSRDNPEISTDILDAKSALKEARGFGFVGPSIGAAWLTFLVLFRIVPMLDKLISKKD